MPWLQIIYKNYLQNRSRVQMQKINLWLPEDRWRRVNWKIETDTYILLYIKQVTNKNPLYSTENSTPYSVVAYMGEESKKGVGMYICITDHFAVYL